MKNTVASIFQGIAFLLGALGLLLIFVCVASEIFDFFPFGLILLLIIAAVCLPLYAIGEIIQLLQDIKDKLRVAGRTAAPASSAQAVDRTGSISAANADDARIAAPSPSPYASVASDELPNI